MRKIGISEGSFLESGNGQLAGGPRPLRIVDLAAGPRLALPIHHGLAPKPNQEVVQCGPTFPGVDPKEVNIIIEGDVLTVKGEGRQGRTRDHDPRSERPGAEEDHDRSEEVTTLDPALNPGSPEPLIASRPAGESHRPVALHRRRVHVRDVRSFTPPRGARVVGGTISDDGTELVLVVDDV